MTGPVRVVVTLIILLMPASVRSQDPRETVFIDWKGLKNPVLEYENWSIKDFAAVYREGVFHVFFSAFYEDRGMTRSHVVLVTTTDWKNWSEPVFNIDGTDQGWTGMCSPNVTEAEGKYYCTFNSWGKKHPNGGTNDLFLVESEDLVHWTPYQQIAAELTKNKTCIDISLLYERGKFFLFFKDDYLDGDRLAFKRIRLASAEQVRGDYRYVGSGYVNLLVDESQENGLNHENYCFFRYEDRWRMLSTDYGKAEHAPWIYSLLGEGKKDYEYLTWGEGYRVELQREDWNSRSLANASALYDWRDQDGYFYLLYAGSTKADKSGYEYAGRGWNKLGLARSKDLKEWKLAGEE